MNSVEKRQYIYISEERTMNFAKIILLISTLWIGVFQALDKIKEKQKGVKNNDFDYMIMSEITSLKVCTHILMYLH